VSDELGEIIIDKETARASYVIYSLSLSSILCFLVYAVKMLSAVNRTPSQNYFPEAGF